MSETTKRADVTWPKQVKEFYYKIAKEYSFESDGFEVFWQACCALARCYEAKALLDEQGLSFTTESGLIKKNPIVEVEKSSRNQFLTAMRILGVSDSEIKNNVGRPARPA